MKTRTQLEFTQYIAPDGEVYNFDNRVDKFITPIGGLGMPPIRYVTQRGPFQHGETLLDYFLEPRLIQVRHRRVSHNRNDFWTHRNDILNHLRPNRQSINSLASGQLRKTFPDGRVRDIDVLVEQGPTFDRGGAGWDEWATDDIIRFIAHNPTFYDPTQVSTSFDFSTFEELVFPIDFPIAFFATSFDETDTLVYSGSWLSYPEIIMTGPMNNPIITNTTTGEKIELDYNISSGEIVTVTTNYGNKTVTNGDGDNLIGTLTTDSDLATFHIAPDPEAPDGNNVFRAQGSGADSSVTNMVVKYYTRYIGI
jgi:hypothetical protein